MGQELARTPCGGVGEPPGLGTGVAALQVLAPNWAGAGWWLLSGLSARSLVKDGGVSCCCWAGGNCFQLLRGGCWSGRCQPVEEDLGCGSAEQAPPGDGGEGADPALSWCWQQLWQPHGCISPLQAIAALGACLACAGVRRWLRPGAAWWQRSEDVAELGPSDAGTRAWLPAALA